MKGDIIPVIGINAGSSNDRTPQITADIFNNGIHITEIGLGIHVKAVFILGVDGRLGGFKGSTDTGFHFVEQGSLKSFTQVSIVKVFAKLGKYLPDSYKEDLKIISEPIDFYCQNIYNGYLIKSGEEGAEWQPHPIGTTVFTMKWPITPECLYWGHRFLYERYGVPIIISENGIACHDMIASDGKVHDPERINFMETYLKELSRAVKDGVDVMGYMYWSFMDNFEWGEGYSQRFGLVYVDYERQKRIPRDSFYWYKALIEAQKPPFPI